MTKCKFKDIGENTALGRSKKADESAGFRARLAERARVDTIEIGVLL